MRHDPKFNLFRPDLWIDTGGCLLLQKFWNRYRLLKRESVNRKKKRDETIVQLVKTVH